MDNTAHFIHERKNTNNSSLTERNIELDIKKIISMKYVY